MARDLIPDIRAIIYVLIAIIFIFVALKCKADDHQMDSPMLFPPLPWPCDWVPHNPHFPECSDESELTKIPGLDDNIG